MSHFVHGGRQNQQKVKFLTGTVTSTSTSTSNLLWEINMVANAKLSKDTMENG